MTLNSTHKTNRQLAAEQWQRVRSDYKLRMAQQQFDTGDLDQAEITLVEAITDDPRNGRLHLLAGRIALERGLLEKAAQRLSRAIEFDPKLAEAHYLMGIVHQRWKQYDKAYDAYTRAYELQADNVAFLLTRGEMLVALDRTDEALAIFREKLDYFDQSAGLRMAIGQLLMSQQQYAEAVEYLRQGSAMLPDDEKALEDLAMARLAARQYKEAIIDFQRLLRTVKDERQTPILRAVGAAFIGAGQLDEAREAFVTLTQLNRQDVEAWIKLAEISLAQNDLAATLSAASRVIALASHRHEGYLIAGIVWQKRGEVDKALSNFDRAAQLAPTEVDAVILRGITLEQAGRKTAAAAAYAEAQRRRPTDPRAARLLAGVQD
jgi:tetratricopeptide (TPR) repeat protein